ncbi:MAG: hypothetical protein LiPW41_471 [Parcubacteria group bacterium LiPW_41]|nr:MAG: hypothetical protein LiPW41_471 [Parcubacteria group bacterium LiPW_41]
MKTGIYISIEGPNGSGKSTLAKRIFQFIKSSGMPAVLNTQPTKKVSRRLEILNQRETQ